MAVLDDGGSGGSGGSTSNKLRTYKVIVSSLRARSKPSVNLGTVVCSYSKSSLITTVGDPIITIEDGKQYYWMKINNKTQYICRELSSTSGGTPEKYMEEYTATDEDIEYGVVSVTTPSQQEAIAADVDAELEEQENNGILDGIINQGYKPALDSLVLFESDNSSRDIKNSNEFNIRSVLGIFGLPYQFMPHVDSRIDDRLAEKSSRTIGSSNDNYWDATAGIGSKYGEEIVANLPLLFMSPGRPSFMGHYSDDEKKGVLGMLFSGNDEMDINDLISKNGRYYTFRYDVAEYYKYVNPMCRIAAAYMGITDQTLDGKNLDQVNWMNYTIARTSGIFNGASTQDYLAIPFYIESDTQVSDSFDNDAGESSIAGTINGASDMARELQFLTGYAGSAMDLDVLVTDPDVGSNAQNLNDALSGIFKGGKGLFGNLGQHVASVVSGGKMIFPKVWSGSGFSRSYNVTIKLRSPDMDSLSLYLNIIVPILHLIGFVAPHMLVNDPNSYGNPFLVRAIYKGLYNIDMGLITSMSIDKGDKAMWNADGIPSSADISLTILDLYDVLSITKTNDDKFFSYDTVNNTAQMDYIATMCGINVYKPEIGRAISIWLLNKTINKVRDFFAVNLWGNLKTSIASKITEVYRRQ